MSDLPKKIYYDITNRLLRDSEGNEIGDESLYPSARLGQKFWNNIQLVVDADLTAYTEIPSGTTGGVIVDNDYKQSSPILGLPGDSGNFWTAGSGSEYYYHGDYITDTPASVYENTSTLMTEGTIGSLSAGEWGWDTNTSRLYVRLSDSTDPDTKANSYVGYKETITDATFPFIEVDDSTFNQASSWYDEASATWRNPDITAGEITYYVNANSTPFYKRLGSQALYVDTTCQIELISSGTALPFDMLEFVYVCRNKYLGEDVEVNLSSINFYKKADADATFFKQDVSSAYSNQASPATTDMLPLRTAAGVTMYVKVGDLPSSTISAHASTHEDGGGDEIDVTDLSGLLADGQTPLAHKTSHENGGSDEIDVTDLSGLLADGQTPLTHASTHETGGSDEINIGDLAGTIGTSKIDDAAVTTIKLESTEKMTKSNIETKLTGNITSHTHNFNIDNGITEPASTGEMDDDNTPVVFNYDEADPNNLPETEVMYLCHYNGSDIATTCPDRSQHSNDFTFNGNAQLDTDQMKFGVSSLLLDGTGDYLNRAADTDFDLTTEDFCLEGFFRFNSAVPTITTLIDKSDSGGTDQSYRVDVGSVSGLVFRWRSSTEGSAGVFTNCVTGVPSSAFAIDTWYMYRIIKSGSMVFVVVDETVIDSAPITGVFTNTEEVRIGMNVDGTQGFNGWIDEQRITVGDSQYTPAVGTTLLVPSVESNITREYDRGSAIADANAIHDNVASEISAITEKTTLVDDDMFIIEDSADSNNKKMVKKANLASGHIIKEGASSFTKRASLMFHADDFDLTDDAVGDETEVRTSSSAYSTTFVDAGLDSAGTIQITHSLSQKVVSVVVADGDDKLIVPDDITFDSTSALTIDLSSFGTLVGTYSVHISKKGGSGNSENNTVDHNSQTGTTYTLVATDAGKCVYMSNSSANTLTIPVNSSVNFPVNTTIMVCMENSGTTSITGATGVSLNGVSAGSCDLSERYAFATLIQRAIDSWYISGTTGSVS